MKTLSEWSDWAIDAGKTAQGFLNKGNGSPPPAPSQPTPQSMPAWLMPAGIGLVVLVILAFAFGGRGR